MATRCEECGFDAYQFSICPVCEPHDAAAKADAMSADEPPREPQPDAAPAIPIPQPDAVIAAAPIPIAGAEGNAAGADREDAEDASARTYGDPDSQAFADELSDLRDQGVFSIGLVGFFEGGKTWFLNRLKQEGRRNWKWGLEPGHARQEEEVLRTDEPSIHHIITRTRNNFAIIDVPGERLGALVRDDDDAGSREERLAAGLQLIDIMSTCSALIIALPADEVLLSDLSGRKAAPPPPPVAAVSEEDEAALAAIDKELNRLTRKKKADRTPKDEARMAALRKRRKAITGAQGNVRKQAQDDLRRQRLNIAKFDLTAFIDQLIFLAALLSLVRKKGAGGKKVRIEDITVREVRAHMTSTDFDAYDKPTFVALTKADLLHGKDATVRELKKASGKQARLATFDRDPLDTVRTFREDLTAEFENCFRWHKFDFVSAFAGHNGSKEIDYNADCKGVHGVIEWIMWVADEGKRASMTKAIERARKVRMRRDGWAGEGPIPPAREVA